MVKSSNVCTPKPSDAKEQRGLIATGDSGEELGDGSGREDESMVEMVVVGEESVESEAWVDVLSGWCWVLDFWLKALSLAFPAAYVPRIPPL